MSAQTSRERPVDGVEQRREAGFEDRRDGVDVPVEVADYEAGRWADDYWRAGS